jgi:hypothetical protein
MVFLTRGISRGELDRGRGMRVGRVRRGVRGGRGMRGVLLKARGMPELDRGRGGDLRVFN